MLHVLQIFTILAVNIRTQLKTYEVTVIWFTGLTEAGTKSALRLNLKLVVTNYTVSTDYSRLFKQSRNK